MQMFPSLRVLALILFHYHFCDMQIMGCDMRFPSNLIYSNSIFEIQKVEILLAHTSDVSFKCAHHFVYLNKFQIALSLSRDIERRHL